PTRDGRLKPDIVAPGSAVGSTTSFDAPHSCPVAPASSEFLPDGQNHRIMEGTSVAAPHAAGAIALLLQKYGALTPSQVAAYLHGHAVTDGFTGAVPSQDWGYGKLAVGDLIDPTAHVLSPNGGENALIGNSINLTCSATDALGSVTSVDLLVSRSGPGGPFATIASGIANSGHYTWNVTGPSTPPRAAYVEVIAHDTNGNTGKDLCDAGFTIGDVAAVAPPSALAFALGSTSPNPTLGRTRVEYT